MARSAWGVSVSVSMALSLPGLGSVVPAGGTTVAVLLNGAVALGSIVPVSVKATVAPLARLGRLLRHTPGATSTNPGRPKTGFNRAAGIVSVKVTPLTVSGPKLVTTIV